jgi:hypothetical protein
MSTDEEPTPGPQPDGSYLPSDPPTVDDWRHLEERANVNRRRSRRGVLLGVVAVAMVIVLGISGLAVYVTQRDVPSVLDNQTVVLRRVNQLVSGLKTSDEQRSTATKTQLLALASIVEGIARGFATPPFPDPDRQKAVDGLCQTAAQFRAFAGQSPDACP